MMHTALTGVLLLETAWALLLSLVLAVSMKRQMAGRKRQAAAMAASPAVNDALAVYMGGRHDLARLTELTKRHPAEVEDAILAFQSKLGGTERARLGEVAIALGFVENWCHAAKSRDLVRRRRAFERMAALSHTEGVRRMAGNIPLEGLADADHQVRLESARALMFSENPQHIVKVFETALTASPLTRLQFAAPLRRHAIALCESAIPRALRAERVRDLITLLRILSSWECSLPLPDVSELAYHPDATVRAETMRLLGLVAPTPQNKSAIARGLADEDLTVAAAAAATVGRLRLAAAIPQMTRCLRRGSPNLARIAAGVLATMPPTGLEALEGQLHNPDPIASQAAREALAAVAVEPAA